MKKISEQELIRRQKAKTLLAKGIDPFGTKFKINFNSKEIIEQFHLFSREDLQNKKDLEQISIAGRVISKRGSGKAGFCHIQDVFGNIQLYVRQDSFIDPNQFSNIWEQLDIGDIIGVKGKAMKTKTGEISVKVSWMELLTKSYKPLPDKYYGLQDIEERLRKRYLDLLINNQAKNVAIMRPKIIRTIQNFLDKKGFLEVETPILQSTLGGASAQPFNTFHNALKMPFYLRIATEIPLKKLIVGGLEKVYEIGRIFRNEGVSKKHNPEFTSIELYQAYADYEDMMTLTEEIFKNIDEKVFNSQKTYDYEGHKINISEPFERKHMVDLIKEITSINFWEDVSFTEAKKLCDKNNIKIEKHWTSTGYIINAFFEKFVEKTIIQPTFVYGYPIEISPLAKKNKKDPRFTDRFELFIIGREYANAFSELTDPDEQLKRFEAQDKEKQFGNKEANEIDLEYIEALKYGLPPTGGIGIGIDRLIMFFTNQKTIREVILFPHNRKQKESSNE